LQFIVRLLTIALQHFNGNSVKAPSFCLVVAVVVVVVSVCVTLSASLSVSLIVSLYVSVQCLAWFVLPAVRPCKDWHLQVFMHATQGHLTE